MVLGINEGLFDPFVKGNSGMDETRDQLKQHLEALEEFEPKYRAYVEERKRQPEEAVRLLGRRPIGVDSGGWSESEMEARKNELLELGPAVDEALVAAGVGVPLLGHPNGGLMAKGVTSLMFNHGPVGLDESGFGVPTVILEKAVAAKGALKTKLKRRPSPVGEATRRRAQEPKRTGNFDAMQEACLRQRARDEEKRVRQEEEASAKRSFFGWVPGFAEKVAVGVVAGLIVAAVAFFIFKDNSDGGSTNSSTPAPTRHHVEVNEISPP